MRLGEVRREEEKKEKEEEGERGKSIMEQRERREDRRETAKRKREKRKEKEKVVDEGQGGRTARGIQEGKGGARTRVRRGVGVRRGGEGGWWLAKV